ncbi:MAG: proline--tRNA ligase [Chloroflexi bacterium]|jgi:prolyl-tRNA synthetase|nr:proline--tRNA ligase [Chloroflexota bacterium]
MRVSRLFGKTLRQAPADADTASHQLLVRAGMIHQVATGIYSYLPLGWRALRKIENIIREEMDAADGQELLLPAMQPFEIWEETGRDLLFGETLFTFKDRRDRKLCLGPTHEEVITKLAHFNIQSYRDLPVMPYQIQTKFRDEPRSRGGLLRVREFLMKDAYSMHATSEDLDQTYERLVQAYRNIYDRCGLASLMVEADSGAIGGKDSHEFMIIAETGEDEIIYCSECDYAANSERASFTKPEPENEQATLPLEEVSTPGKKTIEEVADFLGIPTSQTLKAVFYAADGQVIFSVIRGDFEVNELKLKNTLKCMDLRLATDDEVQAAELVAGSASPIGITGTKVVADDSITLGTSFVVGANKPDAHLKNANYPRDFKVDILTDIAMAQAGYQCPKCKSQLLSTRGIEVGHLFKLGTIFSEKLDAVYLDQDGTQKPVVMGCYGIGVGRLLAAAVEQNHDDKGIVWPVSIAPYQVYICALSVSDENVVKAADKLYSELKDEGFEVLLDDRDESAGVKFNDADLMGIPLRVVISPRNLKQNSAEVKQRNQKESELVPLEKVIENLRGLLAV